MLNFLLWGFFTFVILSVILLVTDQQVEKLPSSHSFRIWWKDHIIGDDIYGDDF